MTSLDTWIVPSGVTALTVYGDEFMAPIQTALSFRSDSGMAEIVEENQRAFEKSLYLYSRPSQYSERNRPRVYGTVNPSVLAEPMAQTTPIEIWEGTVLRLDEQSQSMHVSLSPKIGKAPDHTGEIDLSWIAEQDRDLVRPGAVFYWTLYKETQRGTIRNSQELRFRRLPNWSESQIRKVNDEADALASALVTATA